MLRATVVFVAIFSVAVASISREALKPKPEEFECEEGCYIPDLDAVIPFGEAEPSKTSCKKYHCSETEVQIEDCGAVGVKPPCYKVQDLSLEYPDCCPKVKCD